MIEEHEETAEGNRAVDGERAQASVTDEDEDGKQDRRTFCSPLYRDPVINMMERRYYDCTHPSIPKSCPPDEKLMHDLWESWYAGSSGRDVLTSSYQT